MSKKSLLFCASEVYPFAKTGGLADVAHALPKALNDIYEVSVVMPLYASIDRKKFHILPHDVTFTLYLGEDEHEVSIFSSVFEGVKHIFIYSPLLCDREFFYGTPTKGYEDNALRFAIFNHAIVALLRSNSYEIAHLNDWQSALVPLLIDQDKTIKTKTLFTIHNLAYQGLFDAYELQNIGIDSHYFTIDALEFYNQINFMKAGIAYSDGITTVSQNYAKEILTPEFGFGLDGFLRHHSKKLKGILNGLDLEHFSPQSDALIEFPYTNITQKRHNKKAYLKEIGLKGITKPLFIFIGRFTEQKGVDLLIETLPKLAQYNCNIAILGDGEEVYQEQVAALSQKHKNIDFAFTYNEALSHRMYASADFLLMPSLFEPCGLNQMISMHYGSLPIVHTVGGLKESVLSYKKFDSKSSQGFGITFTKASASSFISAIKEALILYERKKDYNSLIKHNMHCDFSWHKSAKLYAKLYEEL